MRASEGAMVTPRGPEMVQGFTEMPLKKERGAN
jgi:hypothetical protein